MYITNHLDKKLRIFLVSKIIVVDIMFRGPENNLFKEHFYSQMKISTKDSNKLYQMIFKELFLRYFVTKNIAISQFEMKEFVKNKLPIFFENSIKYYKFINERENISKFFFNLIIEFFNHKQIKDDEARSFSLYFYLNSIEFDSQVLEPQEYIKECYMKFFNLHYRPDDIKEFTSFITVIYTSILSKTENSFLIILTNDVLDIFLRKLNFKDSKNKKITNDYKCYYFFYFERFMLYFNYLHNYGDSPFAILNDQSQKNFFLRRSLTFSLFLQMSIKKLQFW